MSDGRTEACGGADNEQDGCGIVFPRQSPEAPLCSLCRKLLNANSPNEKALILVSVAFSLLFMQWQGIVG